MSTPIFDSVTTSSGITLNLSRVGHVVTITLAGRATSNVSADTEIHKLGSTWHPHFFTDGVAYVVGASATYGWNIDADGSVKFRTNITNQNYVRGTISYIVE